MTPDIPRFRWVGLNDGWAQLIYFAFDLLFARDPARTPVLIRVPLSLGTFSLELMR